MLLGKAVCKIFKRVRRPKVMLNLWNTMEITKLGKDILSTLDPKYEEPSISFTAGEKSGNTTPEGTFTFTSYTVFGWFKLTARSYGQLRITTGNKVECEISLNDRAFYFFGTAEESDWKFDFDADGFTLAFQNNVREFVEGVLRGDSK
jgi:hypothetical protein